MVIDEDVLAELTKDDMADYIATINRDVIDELEELNNKEQYLEADIENRRKYCQSYYQQENEIKEVKIRLDSFREIKKWLDKLNNDNDIKFEEE